MLRNTLGNVIEMTRSEARLSTNTSRSIDHLAHVTQLIRRHYQTLVEDWDWEHLRIKREDAGKAMAAGQRYYDFPIELNTDKPFVVWHRWGNTWNPVANGITPEHYSVRNSDNDERQDPVSLWDWYGYAQFEVWPLPASASGEIRFEGQKKAEPLIDNDSRLDIDDILVSMYAAAEILSEHKNQDAATIKLSIAQARLVKMRGAKADASRCVMGMGGRTGRAEASSPRLYPRAPKYIGG